MYVSSTEKKSSSEGPSRFLEDVEENLPAYDPTTRIDAHDKGEGKEEPYLSGPSHWVDEPVEATRTSSWLKWMKTVILVLSALTAMVLLASFFTIVNAPFTKTSHWSADAWHADVPLVFVMIASFVYTLLKLILKPRLHSYKNSILTILDLTLFANIIPQIVRLVSRYPKDNWCHTSFVADLSVTGADPNAVMAILPDPKCSDWRLVCRVLSAVATGLAGVVAIIYLANVVYRMVAYRTRRTIQGDVN